MSPIEPREYAADVALHGVRRALEARERTGAWLELLAFAEEEALMEWVDEDHERARAAVAAAEINGANAVRALIGLRHDY